MENLVVRSSSILTKFAWIVILGSIILSLNLQASAQDKFQLSVDASKPGPKIDRNIFGQFAEHLGYGVYEGLWVGPDSRIANTRGIRNDVVAALKALKVPNVRWPGGCFADEYHWRKGIGTRAETLNPTDANLFSQLMTV